MLLKLESPLQDKDPEGPESYLESFGVHGVQEVHELNAQDLYQQHRRRKT